RPASLPPLHVYPDPFRMESELRRIHTFHTGHSITKFTRLLHYQRVFENIHPFWDPREKELRTYIFRRLIITKPALPPIPAQHIDGLETSSPHIFQMHVFQVPVGTQHKPHHYPAPDMKRPLV